MKHRIVSLACLLSLATFAAAADWSHWRGPWQNGASPEKNLPAKWSAKGENLVWKAPYGTRSTPLVLNGRVYIINYAVEKQGEKELPETIQERVMCLDEKDGHLIWQHRFNVFHSDIVTVRLGWTNLAADPKTGNIYAHGTQGLLFCFSKDGKVLWQRSLTEEFGRITGYGGRVCSPTVDENLVIVGMINSSWGDHAKGTNRFIACDKDTGEVVWWTEAPGQMKGTYYSVPVVATINGQRLLITGASDGSVHAFKIRTGELVWSYNYSIAAINTSPVVDGNFVYIGHGEENPDENVQGRFICLDASKVSDGQPALVWERLGLKCRYASPVLDTEKQRLYIPDEVGKLHCLNAKTGKTLWKYGYSRSAARGSPILADGKIYVGEVNARFYILDPGDKECKELHEEHFVGPGGQEIEFNGSPAAANGRVYFGNSDEFFCIGLKDAKSAVLSPSPAPKAKIGKASYLQIVPAETSIHAGDSLNFKLRLFDANGNFVADADGSKATWSLPDPPLPPGAKKTPPPLKADIKAGKLTVDAKMSAQQGYVLATLGDLSAKARVRVAPRLPYAQDFEKLPVGASPAGWVNAAGKLFVADLKGDKVLRKLNNDLRPPFSRGNAYMGPPTMKDYTIECDVMGTKVTRNKEDYLPEIGIGANRYALLLVGGLQKLRIVSWEALPRIDSTINFNFEPSKWYRMKLTVDVAGGKGTIRGKVWPRGEKEPAAWTVEAHDPKPNTEGSPALYGYVTGITADAPGNEIYYDNVKISPNRKVEASADTQEVRANPGQIVWQPVAKRRLFHRRR